MQCCVATWRVAARPAARRVATGVGAFGRVTRRGGVYGASSRAASRRVLLCGGNPLRRDAVRRASQCSALKRRVRLCGAVCCVVLRCVVVLCCVALWCVVLCCGVLCCVVLCCVVCCVVLCCVAFC